MAEQEQQTTLKNAVTIEQAGPCRKKVIVEIPEETIKTATDEQYKTLGKEAMVPGFRKGHAPRRLLEIRFGKEITEQIKLKLLADASDSAIKDNLLDVLRQPDIDYEKIELPAAGPLKFDFQLEVRPDFDLPSLDGIPVEKTELKVTAKQIDKEIDQLRKWSGVWMQRKTGGVKPDDQVIADVFITAEDAEAQKLDNVEIYVRPKGFVGAIPVENLDEFLAGTKPGDSRQTTVEVPKTYFKEEYRGKKVDVQITVKEVKWLKPAEVNEDFLKRLGVENENEMREKISDMLHHRRQQEARAQMAEQIYKYLLDSTDFELPVDITAEHSNTILQRQYSNLLMRGLSAQQITEQMEQLRAASEQQAREQLKTFFIMDKVAKELEIDVSEEEVNGSIAQLAIQRGQRPQRLREQMVREGSLEQFRLQVRENKCIAKLLESAKIAEVKPKKSGQKPAGKSAKKTAAAGKKQARKSKSNSKK